MSSEGPVTYVQAIAELRQPDASSDGPALVVIERRRGWIPVDWRELWQYRELLFFFTWRDIKIRYKQTVLGAAWAVLQPALTAAVFTLFFGRLARVPSDDIPYPLFAFAGLLIWTFVANAVSFAGASLVNSAHLITKVYFPRMLIPAAPIGAGLVDFAIGLGVFGFLMLWYGVAPSAQLIFVPVCIVLAALTALGVGLWLSALTACYRDFRFVIPFFVQIWLFCSPVVYPASLVPARWQWLFAMNPMTGIVGGCRAALLNRPMPWGHLAISGVLAAVILAGSLVYFRRVERRLADFV